MSNPKLSYFRGSLQNDLRIYPNPFTNKFSIQYTLGKDEDVLTSIYDIQGNEITRFESRGKHKAGGYELEVDVSNFSSGTYIVRLKSSDKTRSIQIVKE